MGDDKVKQLEYSTWLCKALTKEVECDLEHAKEIFMEAKKIFIDASTSERKDRAELEMDPSMLMMLLGNFMKLLHNSKVVKGLLELINRWDGRRRTLGT